MPEYRTGARMYQMTHTRRPFISSSPDSKMDSTDMPMER